MRISSAVLTLVWSLISLVALATPAVAEDFPLAVGTRWTYSCEVKWQVGKATKSTNLTWNSDVVRRLTVGTQPAAELSGFPADLASYEDGRKPGRWFVVMAPGGACHVVRGVKSNDDGSERPLADSEIAGEMGDDTLQFVFPLARGKAWGEAGAVKRNPGRYCWLVDSAKPVDFDDIPALSGPGKGTEYGLVYRTNPDSTLISFIPGIGITRYEYHHNGTVADCVAGLLGFKRGGDSGAQ